jgi:hypothetical protein
MFVMTLYYFILKIMAMTLFVIPLITGLQPVPYDIRHNGFVPFQSIRGEIEKYLNLELESFFYPATSLTPAAAAKLNTYSDVSDVSRDNTTYGSNSNISRITTNNHPSVYPNPVGSAGKVRFSADYASSKEIAEVRVDIRGPNLGSSKSNLVPPIVGSLSLTLVSGSTHDGVWNGTFTFPGYLPDGSYIYSLMTTSVSGITIQEGPFSGIVLDRYGDNTVQDSDTKIISAIDGSGKQIPVNGTSFSSNMTFIFNGTDKTGVVLEIQCNIDDTIILTGHEHAFDINMPMTTYSSCLVPNNIASQVTGSYSYSNLAVGNHTFKIRVLDNEYHTENTPDIFNWTILPSP